MSVASEQGAGEAPRPRRRWASWGFGALALAALVGSIWYAYEHGLRRASGGPPPLIRAEPGPARVKPEDPGGLKVPFQDQTVYKEIAPKGERLPQQAQPERLLPPPEEPLPKPKPPEPAAGPPPPAPPPALAATQAPPPAASTPAPPPATPPVAAAPVPPVNVAPANPPANLPSAGTPIPLTPPVAAPAPAPTPAPPPAQASPVPVPPTLSPPAQVAVAPTPAAPAPAPKTAPSPGNPSGGIRVQLGAFADQPSAEQAWIRIKGAHGDLLGNTSPNVSEFVPADGRKPVYRLQAGPFADLGRARNACAELKARKVDCIVRP